MTVTPSTENKICTLLIEGDIDTLTASELEKAVDENAKDCEKLILDLSDVEYVSSAGIRVVLIARNKIGKDNFILKNLNVNVAEIFRVTGFSKVLNIE